MNLSWIQGFECALRAGGRRSGAARSKRGAARSMPYRLVSPDRKLYLVDNEHGGDHVLSTLCRWCASAVPPLFSNCLFV